MAKYIPLESLVAEIKKYKDSFCDRNGYLEDPETNGLVYDTFCELEDSIDTLEVKEIGVDLGDPKGDKSAKYIIDTKHLEVKEVDLEKELIEWHKEHFKKDGTFIRKSGFYLTNNSQMDIAKHFFELGLKAQKGEEV